MTKTHRRARHSLCFPLVAATTVVMVAIPSVSWADVQLTCMPGENSTVSITISPSRGWSIAHQLPNGTVVWREVQYAISAQNATGPVYAWRGTLKRKPSLTMVGALKQDGSGQYRYNESLYDSDKGGQKVNDLTVDCTSSTSSAPTATQAPPSPPPAIKQADLKPFEGLWAISSTDCKDPDGPNYKTFIKGAVFDQYENHCKILKATQSGDHSVLDMTCDAEGETVKQTATITPMKAGKILIEQFDGKRVELYERCDAKAPATEEPQPAPPSPPKQKDFNCSDNALVETVKRIIIQNRLYAGVKTEEINLMTGEQIGINLSVTNVTSNGMVDQNNPDSGKACTATIQNIAAQAAYKRFADRKDSWMMSLLSDTTKSVQVTYNLNRDEAKNDILITVTGIH